MAKAPCPRPEESFNASPVHTYAPAAVSSAGGGGQNQRGRSRGCATTAAGTKELAMSKPGAERAQPAGRAANALVRRLQTRLRCTRAFTRTCKTEQRKQPPACQHRTLVSAATPRRRRRAHLAPAPRAAACARASQRGHRNNPSRVRTGFVFVIQRSAPAHPPRTSCPLKRARQHFTIYMRSARHKSGNGSCGMDLHWCQA